ncbi:LacI family DNA-binding transcriptional regulator [Pseudonocardia acaciae]|uniref:LacI family DNA-binding transcriptional regulator n=1 Tax=Pseudonocardia acaciae TaxID=551276 RepID=UPI00055B0353|nr:LacI family DNA-binding transcriptional regulator [Pseudonocardia acaciae]
MRTIADEAGVHVSTVSRVLSRNLTAESEARLSDGARRVLKVARKLGYVPDTHAASLRGRRTKMLGVLVPRLADVVLANMYEAIEEAVTDLGYQSVVATTRDQPEEQRRRVSLMMSRRVDGLLVADASLAGGYVDELAARDVPFVLVNRRYQDFVAVTCDDELGGHFVGTHLADLGHEVIAITGGLPYASTTQDRVAGVLGALRERGLDVPEERILLTGITGPDGRAAADRLLAAEPRPTAIFAANDWAAIGVMGALRDHGLTPGTDVAVVGFNDIQVSADLPIPLTTVRNPVRDIGATAARLIADRVEGRPVSSVLVQPRLVVRQSSDPRMAQRARTHAVAP